MFAVPAGSAVGSTRDLNLELHFGHSKIPTQNCGVVFTSSCFLNVTGQLLTAETTSVPQLGHSTNLKTSQTDLVPRLKCVMPKNDYAQSSSESRAFLEQKWKEVELDAYLEHQPFNEFLVTVPNSNLSHLRNLSYLPLRLPLPRQHRRDVARCRRDSCWTTPRRELKLLRRRQNLVRNLLNFSLHRQLIGELGYVLAWSQAAEWNS